MNSHKNKVLLLYPAVDHEQFSMVPLSLLYVAQPLLEAGLKAVVVDQRFERDFFSRLRQELTPDLLCVGISCITGPQIKQVISIGKFIKKMSGVPVVLGGPHATLFPEQVLGSPLIDYVVLGRGERPFLHLVSALQQGGPIPEINHIGLKINGKTVIHNEPEPVPEVRPVPYHLVTRYGRPPTIPILTSWGCPFRCNFCVEKVLHPEFYQLPAADVLMMVEEALRLNPRFINFFDDNFLVNNARLKALFSMCRDKGLVFQWLCTGRADVMAGMDDQSLQWLRQNGMFGIYFGVESGSPTVQKLINKGIAPEMVLELNIRLQQMNIIPHYGFMAGFPTETKEDLRMTLNLMKRLKEENPAAVIWKINHFTPYPGTGLYDLAVQHGYQAPQTMEAWANAFFYSHDHEGRFDARY